MACTVSLALMKGVTFTPLDDQQVAVTAPLLAQRARVVLKQVTPGLLAALQSLAGDEGASIDFLVGSVVVSDGPAAVAKLRNYLERLQRNALIAHLLVEDGSVLASAEPLSAYYRFDGQPVDGSGRWRLSRFAYCHGVGGAMALHSPLGHAEVRLPHPATWMALAVLAEPVSAGELAGRCEGLSDSGAALLLGLLAATGAVLPCAADGRTRDSTDPTLAPWDFHDLLFHSRSRLGRHANPYGGTYPFKDTLQPLPVVKPPMSSEIIPLLVPDLDAVATREPAFSTVLESRRSLRNQGDTPLSIEQLGEFLYRSARVEKQVEDAGVSFRPHPAGGALHELEIYPLVEACTGLDAGLYHYDPRAHALERLSAPSAFTSVISDMAGYTAALQQRPQVLLVVTARFQRLQIKYQSVSYAVMLKNVGALYQTMYLVATAMGLAPCALGGGHSDLFAQAAGLDYYAETSVGEFILGSRGQPRNADHPAARGLPAW